jgi:hypothetical protein
MSDLYLLEAAGRLRRDWQEADAAAYLVRIETEHMGLRITSTTRLRAEATAKGDPGLCRRHLRLCLGGLQKQARPPSAILRPS